jgi:hypothetical protein
MISMFPQAVRRTVAVIAFAGAAVAAIAARPPAPGVSYRVRISMTPPDIPGMPVAPMTIVGHGVAIGGKTRVDIDSVSGQMTPVNAGDYMLTVDSGQMVTVSPSTQSYSDGSGSLMAAAPPQLLAQASVTNVNVTTEKLGPGETIQGYATEKVRMTTTYVLNIMGQTMNTMNVSEMSVAKLPASVTTPFDGNLPKELLEGPMKELGEKMVAARKALGDVTALKTVNTSTMTTPMLPQPLSTVISIELLDVKASDVDPTMLKIPEGYTKKP